MNKGICLFNLTVVQISATFTFSYFGREEAIADALRIAREKFKDKLKNEIEKTKRFCEKIMQDEKRKIQDLHQVETVRLRER